MGVIDTLLKASVIVAVAAVSTAVAYHYVIYVPQRDAAADAERRDQENRATAEKLEAEQRKIRISVRYEACNRSAASSYSYNWNTSCARISQLERTRYNECISNKGNTKDVCDLITKPTTKPEDCALPSALADGINNELTQAKDRCLREFQLGLD